jgi:hypothetical protein
MLSLNKGRPIAIVKNGRYNNQIVHLFDPHSKCCEKCSDSCKNTKNKCCKDCLGGSCGSGGNLKDSKTEFTINDSGILQPLPNFNKPDRNYIAGPTDSGKSYYIKNLLLQLRKVYPEKPIHIFSDVDEDPELDNIPLINKYKLDSDMIMKNGYIKPEKLSNSIVVFDDIDSIQNKEISKIISSLRDSLLRRGRHESISVIVTSHLLTNYKDTRIILNESDFITLFPKAGNVYSLKYILEKYVGLSRDQIKKLLALNSRWVTIYKRYPNYIMYEKGIYLI